MLPRLITRLLVRCSRWFSHSLANQLTVYSGVLALACIAWTAALALGLMAVMPAFRHNAFAAFTLLEMQAGIVILLSASFALKIVRRKIDKTIAPLCELAAAASELAEGSQTIRQQLAPGRRDEIGTLSRAFLRMYKSIAENAHEQESRVARRTQELAETRSRLACILESMQDAVYSISLDQRKVLYVSPACYTITGLSEMELYERPQRRLEICHPEDAQRVFDVHSRVLQEGSGEVNYRIQHQNGEWRWVQDRFYLVLDSKGKPSHVDGLIRDITEQVLSELARKAAEELLRLKDRALAASVNGIVICDVLTSGNPLIYVNAAFEQMTGYQAAEVLGRNMSLLNGPETSSENVAELSAAIQEGREAKVRLCNYRKDGSTYWTELTIAPVRDDDSGVVTHFIGVQTDISVARETEQRLFEWFVRFDAIFTLSPDGFVSFDQSGKVSYVNPSFERMLGLNSGDLLGLSLAELDAILAARADPAHAYSGLLGEDGQVATGKDLLMLSRPRNRTLQWSARDSGADSASTVLYFRDVTREAEVDRMKSEFLSTAAHELRTPMASIMGFSELLLARRFDEGRTRDMLETINRQSVRLTNLLNELLDLARIEARAGKDFQLRRQSLLPVIRETLQSVLVPGDTRTVRSELPEELPETDVDIAKFQQALTNIISNAYKYSPQGGEISLRIQRRTVEGRNEIGIEVQDCGIGMTPEQLAHACERFYRADSSCNIPGTGLGLSLVREIMSLHGGEIAIASEAGVGTRVTLWLPLPEESSVELF